MKAYRATLLIIDHDEIGPEDIADVLRNTRYSNGCISPRVEMVEGADIGEWTDGHPLNHPDTAEAEYRRIFPTTPAQGAKEER